MAVRELQPVEHFVIDAGGDLYLKGTKACGKPWSVGIRHPAINNAIIESISVSDRAVCTSGHYERGSLILDPRSGSAARSAASVTVVAPTAMLADAAATAAFVLGPDEGIRFLDRLGVDGLIFSSALDRYATHRLCQ
jgi:thiamine biosynthesis lipoprotein